MYISVIRHQTRRRGLWGHGGDGVLASDSLPSTFDINLVRGWISKTVQNPVQPWISLHTEFPVPWVSIRAGIGSNLITAWKVLRFIVSITILERIFDCGHVWVVPVGTAASPSREAFFEAQFRDYTDSSGVGKRGTLIEHHLTNDIGAIGR